MIAPAIDPTALKDGITAGLQIDGRMLSEAWTEPAPERAPIVEFLTSRQGLTDIPDLLADLAAKGHELLCPGSMSRIGIGAATCGLAAGAGERAAVLAARHDFANHTVVRKVGCIGACFCEPLVDVRTPDGRHYLFGKVDKSGTWPIIHTAKEQRLQKGAWLVLREREPGFLTGFDDLLVEKVINHDLADFFACQRRLISGNCGLIDPENLAEYIATGGYFAAAKALLEQQPADLIAEIAASGLRGRGGGGFPTGAKWEMAAKTGSSTKIVIANADEGDPGAYMDRTLMESDPHRVLEGIMLAAYAIGAQQAHIFIRHEYPLAIRRMRHAITSARAAGLLGNNILGSDFSLEIGITTNAGAFVCGEETALLSVMEGKRGEPSRRPPYPAEAGLNGHPTVINNIETFANVPWIMTHGSARYREAGTAASPGTKIFCLTGDVSRSGFVEVPLGIGVTTVIEKIGGAPPDPIKAIQIGGPSGGIVPYGSFNLDYETMAALGGMIGSGGLVVLNNACCLVDLVQHMVGFMADESCGRCLICRDGLARLEQLLHDLTEHRGNDATVSAIEQLSHAICNLSLCGLGSSAVHPVFTTLRFFRQEYEQHARGECPAAYCSALIRLKIVPSRCTDNQICYELCPQRAIQLDPGRGPERYRFDHALCTRCRLCLDSCPHGAIVAVSGEDT